MDIKFAKAEIPKLEEIVYSNENYVRAGEDNKFFVKLIDLYDNSSIHYSFVNNLAEKIVGSGMVGSDETSTNLIKQYNLNELFFNNTLDLSLYGGYSIEVIWNKLHTKLVKFNYLDFSKVRSGQVDPDTDDVKLYYYSNDWFKYKYNLKRNVEVIQAFDPDPGTDNRQIFYYRGHHPGDEIYPRPLYYGGLKWIYTDIQLNTYYANLVKNNFVANVIINVNSAFDPEKQVEFEKAIKNNFTGSESAGSIVVLYTDGQAEKPIEILEINKGSDDEKYQWLSQQVTDQIVRAHRIPNPIIAGIRVSGTLGASQEIMDAEAIYNKNVVYPNRKKVLDNYNILNNYILGGPIQYDVQDTKTFDENE